MNIPLMNEIKTSAAAAAAAAVVVVSHIQRIGCQPEKNYFTRPYDA